MLYCYPVAATTGNWFHDCLVEMLGAIHDAADLGNGVLVWPEIVPNAYRARLSSRTGLQSRLQQYESALRVLTGAERNDIRNDLFQQNEIALLLSGAATCRDINQLPDRMREPIRELFKFAFGLMSDLNIRDPHYEIIYNSAPSAICPFCGCEFFDAPGGRREALDHYLAESIYPFAAANLRNLVPMGYKCNTGYKSSIDVLRANGGVRRRVLDPYGQVTIRVSLVGSAPIGTAADSTPSWQIRFVEDSEEAATWDAIFRIRERYERDVLTPELRSWFDQFASWCRSAQIDPGISDDGLIDALDRYTSHLKDGGLQDRNFLRAEVFASLLLICRQGDARTISFMRRLAALKTRPTQAR